jgi:hypothetical protein
MKRLTLLVACTLALVSASCGQAQHPTATPLPMHDVTPELTSMRQLQAAFNAHPGVPRLIVLASPT